MALPLTETDKFLLLSAVGAPETRDRIAALLDLAGTGNMTGPASATDNALVRFDGSTGALVQNSGATLSDANVLLGLTGLAVGGALNPLGDSGSHITVLGTTTNTGNIELGTTTQAGAGGNVGGVSFLNGANRAAHLFVEVGSSNTNGKLSLRTLKNGVSTDGVVINEVQNVTIGSAGGTETHTINGQISLIGTGPSTFGGQVRAASLSVANSAVATTLGTVQRKVEIFNASGVSLGFVAVYDAIS